MQQQYYYSSTSDEYNNSISSNSELVVPPWRNGVGGGFFYRNGQLGNTDDCSMLGLRDAKALAASRSHSEAERRRRERINNHLASLRTLLPATTKTDKASLLADVIQHVKELKRQTSEISERTISDPFPTEIDELTVDNYASGEDGKAIIKASICCEDRSDLLPDLIKTLKALKLRAVKAEIATLGGRVKNVLFITAEDKSNEDDRDYEEQCHIMRSIKEAFKAVMEKSIRDNVSSSSSGSVKRQRTISNVFNYKPF